MDQELVLIHQNETVVGLVHFHSDGKLGNGEYLSDDDIATAMEDNVPPYIFLMHM
ncbi:MAG: hypothetical protein OCD02_04390 [Spirochaetaceae bacterium]